MGKLNTWIPNSFNLNKGLYAWDGKGREMLIYSTTNNRTEQNFSKKKSNKVFLRSRNSSRRVPSMLPNTASSSTENPEFMMQK